MQDVFKEIKFYNDARSKMKEGIDILANAVKITLGPKGNNVIIGNTIPHVTKDGVTVAKEINLRDPFQNVGAQLVKEVASKTCTEIGDGTTTSSVLIQAIINCGLATLSENPTLDNVTLVNQINDCAKNVIEQIQTTSIPITDDKIRDIATISANNDSELGQLIADAFKQITRDGVIVVEESKNINTSVEIISGMRFDRGFLAPHFITDQIKNEAVLENPYILITDQKINSTRELINILDPIVSSNKSILLIAEDFDNEVIENLKINKLNGILKVIPIKAPSFGEYRKDLLYDLAILTDGTYVGYDSGLTLNDMQIQMLGRAEKVVVTKDNTTIIGGFGKKEHIDTRVTQLKQQLDNIKESQSDQAFLKDFLQQRIAKLVSGIAIIYVGGTTELEMKQRKDRVDDAVAATKAAIEEGVVIGGGITYLQISDAITPSNYGETVIKNALIIPFIQILLNCGLTMEQIDKIHKDLFALHQTDTDYGYNAKTNQIEDLLESGVIDPTKVTKIAFQNAVSIATLFLTTECIIVPEIQNQLITF